MTIADILCGMNFKPSHKHEYVIVSLHLGADWIKLGKVVKVGLGTRPHTWTVRELGGKLYTASMSQHSLSFLIQPRERYEFARVCLKEGMNMQEVRNNIKAMEAL